MIKPMKPSLKTGLAARRGALNTDGAAHLLRRTCFGGCYEEVAALENLSAPQAVKQLVSAAQNELLPPEPEWALEPRPADFNATQASLDAYRATNRERRIELLRSFILRSFDGGLRERMVWFWGNHFVAETPNGVFPQFSNKYWSTLRQHALGNFRDFTSAIGIDPLMLFYLDGRSNRRVAPNENYARELLELFTMGQEGPDGSRNYEEEDIRDIARALTGWIAHFGRIEGVFQSNRFDAGEKTILGRTGNFGYSDVIEIMFEERATQIAHHVCRKLYMAFVYEVPDEELVSELAEVFLAADFEIAPVLTALFQSERFFDKQIRGAIIKSPIEALTAPWVLAGQDAPETPTTQRVMVNWLRTLGQDPFRPPNVAGWPGGRAWLDASTLTLRADYTGRFLRGIQNEPGIDLLALVHQLHAPADPHAPFFLARKLAQHFMAVPVDELDVAEISSDFAGDLIGNPIPDFVLEGPEIDRSLAKALLGDQPWYEWDGFTQQNNLRQYIEYLMSLPEFQLA